MVAAVGAFFLNFSGHPYGGGISREVLISFFSARIPPFYPPFIAGPPPPPPAGGHFPLFLWYFIDAS